MKAFQSEVREKFAEYDAPFERIDERFERIDQRFDKQDAAIHRLGVLLEDQQRALRLVLEAVVSRPAAKDGDPG